MMVVAAAAAATATRVDPKGKDRIAPFSRSLVVVAVAAVAAATATAAAGVVVVVRGRCAGGRHEDGTKMGVWGLLLLWWWSLWLWLWWGGGGIRLGPALRGYRCSNCGLREDQCRVFFPKSPAGRHLRTRRFIPPQGDSRGGCEAHETKFIA